jgi:hypothetical protein
MDLHAMSPAESLKSVLAPIWTPITLRCTGGGALRSSVDGLRPRAGQSATCGRGRVLLCAEAGRSASGGRTVHEGGTFANNT